MVTYILFCDPTWAPSIGETPGHMQAIIFQNCTTSDRQRPT